MRSTHLKNIASKDLQSKGRVYPSIDLVSCGNIWKETHKLFDPDKLSVGNLLSPSRVNLQTQTSNSWAWVFLSTGWRRLIESLELQIIFHQRATKYRSLLRKMTYKDKGSYESSPPCTKQVIDLIGTEKSCPILVEINSNSIDGQTWPYVTQTCVHLSGLRWEFFLFWDFFLFCDFSFFGILLETKRPSLSWIDTSYKYVYSFWPKWKMKESPSFSRANASCSLVCKIYKIHILHACMPSVYRCTNTNWYIRFEHIFINTCFYVLLRYIYTHV